MGAPEQAPVALDLRVGQRGLGVGNGPGDEGDPAVGADARRAVEPARREDAKHAQDERSRGLGHDACPVAASPGAGTTTLHSLAMQIRGRLKRRRRLGEPAWFEERVRQIARDERLHHHAVFGDEGRLRIDRSAQVHNATFNTVSGTITVHPHAFFGHGVSVLTGTHDITKEGAARSRSFPRRGRDIVIEQGAWVASNATILGPCTIGEHAVVAAGAVVTGDVPARTIYAGVPAKQVGTV